MSAPILTETRPNTFQAEAVKVWLQLQTLLAELNAKVQSPWTRARIANSVLSGLDTYVKTAGPRSIETLSPSGATTMRVIRGEKTPAWWEAAAQTVRDSLTYVAQQVGAALPTWERIYSEVVAPTASTIATGAKELTTGVADLVPWVAAALIAGVLGYLVFTFRRL